MKFLVIKKPPTITISVDKAKKLEVLNIKKM